MSALSQRLFDSTTFILETRHNRRALHVLAKFHVVPLKRDEKHMISFPKKMFKKGPKFSICPDIQQQQKLRQNVAPQHCAVVSTKQCSSELLQKY